MKKKFFAAFLVLAALLPVLAVTARADCAPKPITSVTVHGGGGERMVLTLLADTDEYGPNQAVEKGESVDDWYQSLSDNEEAAWTAFRDYEDPDGFYFWGLVFSDKVDWTYYPPEQFKVAVYYPDYDVLLVSEEVFQRYAFQSDFRVYLPALGENAESGTLNMELKQQTDWFEEIAGFLMRAALTLAVELGLAWLWGYSAREQLRLVFWVNLLTQVGLNGLLWLWYYLDGPMAAMLRLVVAEVVVLTVEAALYLRRMPDRGGKLRTVGYALVANLASVVLGFYLLA